MTQREQWLAQRYGVDSLQFPKEVTGKITIYVRYADPDTGLHMNYRCVLDGVFWNESNINVWQRTGVQVANSAIVYLPVLESVTGRQYVDLQTWNNATPQERKESIWTVDVGRRPLIIQGESLFEFTSGTDSAVTRQENDLISANPLFRRIQDFNPQLFGPEDMQHLEIRTATR